MFNFWQLILFQILEQVCRKFNFDSNNYGLLHHNKLLDLQQMFRFAGIVSSSLLMKLYFRHQYFQPNNANLEMTEVSSNKHVVEQNILICLQLEDGTRLEGNFSSNSLLRTVISDLCPDKAFEEQSPVLVYMRALYHSKQLDTVTLKDLGLSGRALLRLMNTDPEKLKLQANISAPLPQKPRNEQTEQKVERNSQKFNSATSINFSEIKRLKQEAAPKAISTDEMQDEPMEIEEETKVEVPTQKDGAAVPETPESDPIIQTPEPSPEPVINYVDDNGTIIFSLDSLKSSLASEVPDSFFDLTEADVKKLYRDLRNEVEQGENKPLMTTALRKLEEDKKILNLLAQYKSTAIRIQMPDRMVVQAKFSKIATIGSVKKFLQSFLVEPDIKFHLCKYCYLL